MKAKIHSIILSMIILMLTTSTSYASTPITGTAYGENIGLIHLDFSTALNPFADCDHSAPNSDNINCTNSSDYNTYHLGTTDDFYISPVDLNFTSGDPAFTSSITDIGDASGCNDAIADACLLNGFMWSNTIGWVILDGNQIQTSIGDPALFPTDNFAHVTFDGVYKGYAWSEYTGWIKFSSDVFNPANPQSNTNWGVYMDPSEAEANPLENSECTSMDQVTCETYTDICEWTGACDPIPLDIGRHLYGYAWSEALGWIEFRQDDFNVGAYTNWVPDLTPPEILAVNEAWFANDSDVGLIIWENFAEDPESGIELAETELILEANSSADFASCDATTVNNDINGNHLTLEMINAGELMTVDEGFCMYEITGKVTNGANITYYIGDPYGTVPAAIKSNPDLYQDDPIVFYVRAGDMNLDSSILKRVDGAGAKIADGKDYIEYEFKPKDLVGNPIIPVKVDVNNVVLSGGNVVEEINSDNWVRDIEIIFNFDADNLNFDTVNTSISPTTLPVSISDDAIASAGGVLYDKTADLVNSHIIFPKSGTPYGDPINGAYSAQTVAFAPTICGASCANQEIILDKIDFTTDDAEMPEVTGGAGVTIAEVKNYEINTTTVIGGSTPLVNASLEFSPALTIDGTLNDTTLVVGVPSVGTFNLNNVSSLDSIVGHSVDSYMNFNNAGAGIGLEVLEVRDIFSNEAIDDNEMGRSDPLAAGSPRYTLSYDIGSISDSAFHTNTINKHSSTYSFYFDASTSTSLDSNGQYDIDGIFDVPLDVDLSEDYPDYPAEPIDPPITIDRGDKFNPTDVSTLALSSTTPITIGFTPSQFIGEGFTTEVDFNLDQYLAYKMQDSPFASSIYAVYEPTRAIEGIEIKNIGVQATGVVTGENVYETVGGRDLDTITSSGSGELKKQIRANAAELARNIEPCPITNLPSLPTTGDCVRIDNNNDTIVAVYEGDSTQVLKLGGSDDITIPAGYKYTLLLKGGANLLITENIEHDTDTSFGMIVLSDSNSEGGNVYIAPEPTNLVGLLYAEGSLLSSPNGTNLYYGTDSLDAGELDNQLYWQGSIVSKNTIGGAPSRIYPDGVDCFEQDAGICSQIYDMDYIRRFSVRDGSAVPTGTGYTSLGVLFSGGGSCTDNNGTCSLGSGETTITLSATNSGYIDLSASKSIDPFFIEKDNRPAPLGFTAGGGFEQATEIR